MPVDHYHHSPTVRRILSIQCVTDRLPWIFYTIVTNGKIAAIVLVACYLIVVSLWIPFWLLSKCITEWGVYLLAVSGTFLAGRGLIRLIAFPGASQKMVSDLEEEFAKYSVRMIDAATSSIIDLATVFIPEPGAEPKLNSRALYNVPTLWKRCKMYRDRVLGVYLEVLTYMYQQDSVSSLVLSTEPPSSDSSAFVSSYGPGYTRYGNNSLSGDIGSANFLSTKARKDGSELLHRLQQNLRLIDSLEISARTILAGAPGASDAVNEQLFMIATQLRDATSELRDFASSLKPVTTEEGSDGDSGENSNSATRSRTEGQQNNNSNTMHSVKTAISSVLPILDPPPQNSIFGFDLLRGCMLSRYQGARQIWVRRQDGGMLDVLHFPAKKAFSDSNGAVNQRIPSYRNGMAVLYCNPNAGLIEVAAGISLSGGNVPTADTSNSQNDSWIDYYTALGIDVYVFNYAGYGRSYGTSLFIRRRQNNNDQCTGFVARLGRIVRSIFLSFKPSPYTLRADGVAVAQFVLNVEGVQRLIIHGESLGGMAASGIARQFTRSPSIRNKIALLICDRTFCNLEAVAQRLVGGWTGYAMRVLAPFWNTDVAGDFLASLCPKIVATDSSDVIVVDTASLKSGISLWKELHRGIATTKGIGWIPDIPLQYRMAEWENVCVNESRYAAPHNIFRAQAPVWPNDKHISFEEAFHFAACCKRIGKFAKNMAKSLSRDDVNGSDIAVRPSQLILQAWTVLGCCDGLTGATLGVATKRGFDATVSWLCSCVVFGGQVIFERAERRMQLGQGSSAGLEIVPSDFDSRPTGFQRQEAESSVIFPKPIPDVLQSLVSFLEIGDEVIAQLSHEFQFIVGMLEYIQARLSAPGTIQSAGQVRRLNGTEDSDVGVFLNLHCGHNNPFSHDEKNTLESLINRAMDSAEGGMV